MGHSSLRSGGRWGLALLLGAGLMLSACGGGGNGEGAQEDPADEFGTLVNIVNFAFDPMELTVPAGTKVTWINQDDAPHDIQDLSELNTPLSRPLNKGDKFSITYPKAGDHPYICQLHDYMKGTVKVT